MIELAHKHIIRITLILFLFKIGYVVCTSFVLGVKSNSEIVMLDFDLSEESNEEIETETDEFEKSLHYQNFSFKCKPVINNYTNLRCYITRGIDYETPPPEFLNISQV